MKDFDCFTDFQFPHTFLQVFGFISSALTFIAVIVTLKFFNYFTSQVRFRYSTIFHFLALSICDPPEVQNPLNCFSPC